MEEVSRLRRSDGPSGGILMRRHSAGKRDSRAWLEPVGSKLFEETRWLVTATRYAPPGKSYGVCIGEGDANRFRNLS
jgi:hypothetical protein